MATSSNLLAFLANSSDGDLSEFLVMSVTRPFTTRCVWKSLVHVNWDFIFSLDTIRVAAFPKGTSLTRSNEARLQGNLSS